jgi:gamma-glutamylcyclotransferase (GGCT)/AIG2-like uncharacterized protein YtfP
MPLLFSYGTLQQTNVQLATFGRLLHGEQDELPGFELSLVRIEDPQVVATSGKAHHANVAPNGNSNSRVSGMVFEITAAELSAADEYEKSGRYVRVTATLSSGKKTWMYMHTSSAGAA